MSFYSERVKEHLEDMKLSEIQKTISSPIIAKLVRELGR